MRPDYAETGIPNSEYEVKKNNSAVRPLLSETIEKMRTVCRVNNLIFGTKLIFTLFLYFSWVGKFWRKENEVSVWV